MQGSVDGIVITDAAHRILEVNQAFEEMTGYPAAELLGKTPDFLFSPRERPAAIEELRNTVRTGKSWRGRMLHVRKDGADFLASLTVALIRGSSDGEEHHFVIMRDVTQMVKDFERLRELTARREEFLSIATHDLRRPIYNQRLLAQLVIEESLGPLNPKQKDFLIRIRNNADYMSELVEDLLSTQVAETGELSLIRGQVDMPLLIRACVERHAAMAWDKSIAVSVDVEREGPPLWADGNRLSQVVNNLLSNAIKYSPRGASVSIRAGSVPGGYEIAVADSGVGIPEDELGRLFEKFARLSPRPTSGEKSTGLGLFIVNKLVALHSGRVTVTSKVGEGSTFRVWLPRED